MLETLFIAFGLSMDAFAVSISSGICIKKLEMRHVLRGSFSFGFFQFIMPVIGWFLGVTFRNRIQSYDHWIAFILLFLIGFKMIWESLKIQPIACEDDENKAPTNIRNIKTLLSLSIATSIDALAVGLSFSILGTGIWLPALIIGGITFVVCLAGFEFGKRIGASFERKAETVGGVILIGIGSKILIEHLLLGC